MATYEIWLPLPKKGCQQNARVHWRERFRVEQDYKRVAWSLMKMGKRTNLPDKFQTPIQIHYKFYTWKPAPKNRTPRDCYEILTNYYPKDASNALGAMKMAEDALRCAGLIPDDSAKHVSRVSCEIVRGKAAQGKTGVMMIVTESNG